MAAKRKATGRKRKATGRPGRTSEQEEALIQGALAGLSARALGKRLGIGADTIMRWLQEDTVQQGLTEAEQAVRLEVLRLIARTFRRTVRKLLQRVSSDAVQLWELNQVIQVLGPYLQLQGGNELGGMDALALIFGRIDSPSSPLPEPPHAEPVE